MVEEFYTAKCTKELIDNFIKLFNSNRVEDIRGNVIKIKARFYPNHEVDFSSTIYTEVYYNENSDKIFRELSRDAQEVKDKII